ncbi:MAG: DNA alkylation repair protein [Dermatophilaceae bacterium]|nr:DNA alkylation repair protein [Dermatophilaceae bacterium]NUO90299.1 DNA alkylation repair protein [Dermatophilaceae bacterium]NUQ32731.1 DNA alkylation repair protein [Dermatophilaceae bacterium]NUR17131.1 DNA alkylation repair protein [Dermatophilaceae bacterium]NUR79894.1 DNA alkylation repair protein [Dermatophilaceae bacterium]
MAGASTAAAVVAALEQERTEADLAKVQARLAEGEPAIGVRMGTLFAIAKSHTVMPLAEVQRLLAHPAYEARLAAFCILDFKARRKRTGAHERGTLARTYLGHHHAITSWDMVDRAAPRVIGQWLVGRDKQILRDLAASADPLRRRTAMTAPLGFLDSPDVEGGYEIAGALHSDRDPLVHKPVGIFLRHAGERDRDRLVTFLEAHVHAMPRPAVRLAVEKLPSELRSRWVGR